MTEKEAPLSANHWNGNCYASVDIEASGPDPQIYEIVQLAILPLNADFTIRKKPLPFYINIKPENPEIIHKDASRIKVSESKIRGFDSEAAIEMLFQWRDKLQLPCTKWGTPKKIYPLGHGFSHDRAFLMRWLGQENYEEIFGPRVLDTMVVACYLNDQASFHAERVPFSKVDLSWLAKQYNISITGRHDALVDAKITADVYRNMCKFGMF